MKLVFYRSLYFLLCIANSMTLSAQTPPDTSSLRGAQYVTTAVRVQGAVENSLTLTVEALKRFPTVTGGAFTLTNHAGDVKESIRSFKGVALKIILDSARIAASSLKARSRIAVIARASDGYAVSFSWNELFNTATGDSVCIVYEQNNLPLGDGEGRLLLLSAADRRTGSRHVRWLQTIEVVELK